MRKVSRTRWITYDDDDDDASYDEWKTKKCKVGNENEKKNRKNPKPQERLFQIP